MPSVLDAPERIEYIEYVETHDLHIEKPRVGRAHPGFWRTLAHGITKHLTHTPRARQAPSCSRPRPCEAPMDRVAQEYPWISILALAII